MRRSNSAACIDVLRERSSCTVTYLAARTGLSRPTVESILTELTEYGLVIGDAVEEHGIGRPARTYLFNADAAYVASVDVGLHQTTGMLADLKGHILETIRLEMPPEIDAIARAASVRGLLRALLESTDVPAALLHTAVVAVPGIVDPQGRMVLSNPIPDWTGADLAARFKEGLPTHVIVENDVNMAALAEHRLGAGRFADDLLLVHVGHRVNAGMILGGALRRGHNYSAGEIADVINPRDADTTPLATVVASEVVQAAARGDAEAVASLREFATRVSTTFALVSAAIDPQLIVVGGGLSGAGETLVGPIREAIRALVHGRGIPEIVVSQLGSDGVVLGGLARALQAVNADLYHAPDLGIPTLKAPARATTAPADGASHPATSSTSIINP